MKNLFPLKWFFFFLFFLRVSERLQSQCVNADFSSGTLAGWTGTWGFGTFCITQPIPNPYQNAGLNQGVNNAAPNSAPQKNHFIMTGGVDPVLQGWGYNLPVVYPGNTYSARIGNMHADGDGESISYSFLVTNNNCNFTYHYATVIQQATDLTHTTAGSQPYFNIKMVDGSNNPITCADYEVDGSTAPTIGGFTNIPGSVTGSDPVLFKPWTTVFIPLNAYIGQTVKITFTTRSCYPCVLGICCGGSHYSYAYIDAECAPLQIVSSSPAICGGNTITLTAPAGAASYAWTGPGVIPPANQQIVTVNQPGAYHVAMMTAGVTPCAFSLDTVIVANPGNPAANFSAPVTCLGSATTFNDLSTPVGNITSWAWDFNNDGITDANGQNPTYTFATTGTFPVKLTVSWPPCTADTTINVVVSSLPTSNFMATPQACVGANSAIMYMGNAPTNATYNWNFDGGTIASGSGQGPYTVNWSTSGVKKVTLSVIEGTCTSPIDTVLITINPIPNLFLSPDAAICTGESDTLVASGAVSYVWSPAGGLNTTSGGTVIATPVSTTTYIVTATTAGCSITDSVAITVSSTPTSLFTAFSPVCAGVNSAITYIGNAPPNANYNWNFDGGTIASGSGQGPYSLNWSTSGTFNVSLVVSIGSCTSFPSIVPVTVNPTPNVGVSPDVAICAGGDTIITASGAAAYSWSPATGLSGTSGASVTTTPASTITYTVTGTTSGCSASASVNITVNQNPTSTFTTTSPVCEGANSAINYIGSASANATYNWGFDGGTIAAGNGQGPYSVNWLTAGIKNLTLDVTENGCSSALTTVTVTVIAAPVSDAGADVTYCSGDSAVLGTASIVGYTYSWSPPTDLSSSILSSPTVSLTNVTNAITTTNYTVTTSDNICSSTDVVTVTVIPIPVASFVSPAGQCMTGNSFSFQAGGSFLPSATFAWDFSSDGTPSTSANQNQSVSYATVGTHTVSLTITQNGCVNTTTGTVDVYPMPVVNFVADTLTGCKNLDVCFTDYSVSTNPSSYLWNFGDGGGSSTQNPCHTFVVPGVYTISLNLTSADGCQGTNVLSNMITIVADPVANFSESNDVIQMPESTIVFLNQSQNAVSYLWNFGTGTTSDETNPQASFTEPGTFPVVLFAYNQFGCLDSVEHSITVIPTDAFFIPNVFSPNGDGNNDFFNIVAQPGVEVVSFEIFNRWGEKVHDNLFQWDGNFKGKPCPPGVYVYAFKLKLVSMIEGLIRKGSVTLIR